MNENSINSFCTIKKCSTRYSESTTPYSYIPHVPTLFSQWLVNDRMRSKCKATGLQTAISPKIYLLVVISASMLKK